MPTPRKYQFNIGPFPEGQCEILSVNDPGALARDMSMTIRHNCCGRISAINYLGMLSRITRGTGLCWKCASDQAFAKSGRRTNTELQTTNAEHPGYVPPPAWDRPPSIAPGFWVEGCR
jgi:hypothetical protein